MEAYRGLRGSKNALHAITVTDMCHARLSKAAESTPPHMNSQVNYGFGAIMMSW